MVMEANWLSIQEMARIRVTARKSVTPVFAQEMIPSALIQPRTRAQAAIRLKQLAFDNQDRIIKRLRVSNAKRRRENEDLNTKLISAVRRVNEVYHMFELARGDTYDLRDTVKAAVGQAKRANEEIDHYKQELAEAREARVEDKKKLEEAWRVIQQLSENNQRLTKEVDLGKAKKKALQEKNAADRLQAKGVLDEAVAKIMTHIDEITELKLENQNLQWQIEDLVEPEEPEEDPEEEEARLEQAIGDGEIE